MRSHYCTNLPVYKGQKVRIRGSNKTYIAETDIISNPVLILGDRAIGKDFSRLSLNRRNELFKLKNEPQSKSEFEWAYLFEVAEFEDTSLEFSETSWEYNQMRGGYEPLGDGSGRYENLTAVANVSSIVPGNELHSQYIARNLNSNEFRFDQDLINGLSRQIGINQNSPGGALSPESGSVNGWLHFSTDRTVLNRGSAYHTIDKDRRYYFYEYFSPSLEIEYRHYLTATTFFKLICQFGIASNGNQSVYSFFSYNSQTFPGLSDHNFYTIEINQFVNDLRLQLESQLSFSSNFTNLSNIYTGQEIIDGLVIRNLQLNISHAQSVSATLNINQPSSGYPRSFIFNFHIIRSRATGIGSSYTYFSRLYREDLILEREKGSRTIYLQIKNYKPIELLKIPLTEPYQGFVCKISNNIEVIIKRGKKRFNFIASSEENFSYSAVLSAFYSREWVKLNQFLISENNSLTYQQEYTNPEPISISSENWQLTWLQEYEDYRLPFFDIQPSPNQYHDLSEKRGAITSLNSGYRTYFGDRYIPIPTSLSNQIYWGLLPSIQLGSMVREQLIYLDPSDLYSVSEPSNQPSSGSYFPYPNYSICKGLINKEITKSVYYRATSSWDGSNFLPGISFETPTVFPPLNVDPSVDVKTIGIAAIAYLGN